MRKLILFHLFIFFFFASCKKESSEVDTSPTPTPKKYVISIDSLTDKQDSILMSNSFENLNYNLLIGADGGLLKAWIDSVIPYWNDTLSQLKIASTQSLTPQQQRIYLLNQTLSVAYTLAQMKIEYDTGQYSPTAPFSPPQWGIAYSWGSRNYEDRLIPPNPDGQANSLHLQDKVKGLDCSGFIWTIFRKGGLPQLPDFSAAGFPAAMNSALPSSTYNGLALVNKGRNLSASLMQPGDIIVWPRHIGIIESQPPITCMLNSHGTQSPSSLEDQQSNQGKKRGVHSIKWFGQADTWFPGGYNVWRLEVR